MLNIILIIATGVILIVYGIIATIGMFKGIKKIELYENAFADIQEKSKKAYEEMKAVDELGAFEADDDVGAAFDEIKAIIDELNNYIDTENIDE